MAAAAGLLLGLGGVATLVVALTMALAQIIGPVAACFAIATLMLSGMLASLVFCLQPYRTVRKEMENMEESTAEALADLPFDTLRALVERRPLTVTAIAMFMGYTAMRDPHAAQRHAERFLMDLI